MKKSIVSPIVFFLVFLYQLSFGQTQILYTSLSGNPLPLESVDVCQDSSFINQVRIQITDNDVDSLKVGISLPDGVNYVPGSVRLVASSRSNGLMVTYDGLIAGANIYSITPYDLITGDYFILEWGRQANCDVLPDQQAGEFFKDDVMLMWDGGSNSELNSAVRSYDMLVPSLSLAGEGPIVTTLGTSVERTITITNGGQGELDEFMFFIVDEFGTSTRLLETLGGAIVTPSSMSGDTLFYTLSSTEISEFGDNDVHFEDGEQILIKRTYSVTECNNESSYQSFWGCGGSICQMTTKLEQSTVIDNLVPNVDITMINLDDDYCYNGDNSTPGGSAIIQTFKVVNSGNGEARNLLFRLQANQPGSNSGYNYFEASDTWTVKDDNGITIGAATHESTFETKDRYQSDCSVEEKESNVRYSLGNIVIPPGDSITIEVPTYVSNISCINNCPGSLNAWYSFAGGWEYKDQCEANNYGVTLRRFSSKAHQIKDYLVEMPTDLIDQQEFTAEIDFSRVYTRVKSSTEGYNDFIIDLTSTSLIYNGGATIVTPFGTLPVTNLGDSIVIRLPSNLSAKSGVMPVMLKADCAGQTGGAQTVKFSNVVSYNGDKNCSFSRHECLNNTYQMHCPSPCPKGGATPKFFTLERMNLGLQDYNDNGVPDTGGMTASPDSVNLHRAVNGDTILGTWNIFVNPNVFDAIENPTDPNIGVPFNYTYVEFDLRKYSLTDCSPDNNPAHTTMFTALPDAEVVVYPAGGGAPTFCMVTPTLEDDPETTQVLNTIAKYDLSSCKPTWEGGDSIVVKAKYISNASINNSGFDLYIADNEVYSSYVPNPTGNNPSDENKYTCDHFNDFMNILRIYNSPYMPSTQDINGCENSFEAHLRQYVNIQAGNVWFPNEYRSFYIQDKYIVDWPSVLEYRSGSAKYHGINIPDANVMQVGEQLIFSNLSQFFTTYGGTITPSDEVQSHSITWSVDPTCDAEIGAIYNARFYAEIIGNGVNTGSGNTIAYTGCGSQYSSNVNMQYDGPLPFISGGGSEQVSSNQAQWEIFLNNGSNSLDAENSWFYINDLNGTLKDFTVLQGGVAMLANTDGFFELGNNPAEASVPYTIHGTLDDCADGLIEVLSGFACEDYPTDINGLSCADTLILESTNLPSEVQLSFITQPTTPMDLCEDQPIKLRLTSAQAAFLDDPVITYTVPNGIIMPSTINVEYPEGSGNVEAITPVLMGSEFMLNLEDHTQISTDGIPGTIDALTPNERAVVIDFMFDTDCDFLSGDNFIFKGLGNRPCGLTAINNGVRIRTVDLNVTGIFTPYVNNFTLDNPVIEGCSGTGVGADIEFVGVGETIVSETDSIYIMLQDNLQYIDGTFTCTSPAATCMQFARSYIDANGDEIIVLAMPSGGLDITNPTTTSFTYEVASGNQDACDDLKNINYSVVNNQGNVPCIDEMSGFCPALSVTIGEEDVQVRIKKPIVTFNGPNTYCNESAGATFSGAIKVDSIALGAMESIVIDVYCSDVFGNPASYVSSITINGPIALGASSAFTGTLSNTCNPNNGVVLQINRMTNDNTEQCLCTDETLHIAGTMMLSCVTTVNENVTCNGENDGDAIVNVFGGTPSYSYLWSNGDTRQNADTLTAGLHTVTITDGASCQTTCQVTISEPSLMTCSVVQDSQVECNGDNTGVATATPTGGTPNYTYLWDNGETTITATMLDAGQHSVIVTDANGCTSSCSVMITEPTPLTCSVAIDSQVVCNGESNGSATVTALGGTMNYTYQWDNGETTVSATMLDAGMHTVVVTDANGCTSSCSTTITEPTSLTCSVAINSQVVCNGESNGSATVTALGGTMNYTYLWDNNETTAVATMLDAGQHSVIVTDANGCESSCSITLTEPAVLACNVVQNQSVSCNGIADGQATVSPSGGNGGNAYLWDNNETTATATMLSSGMHTVTVTDSRGCRTTCTINIDEPVGVSCSTTLISNVICNNESNGSASVTPAGGTPNYTYLWDNGETTITATMLDAGQHSVIVTDANGCTSSCSVMITEPTSLTCSVAIDSQVVCNGESNGLATVTALGGTMNYTYQWDNGETTASATMLDAGMHTVVVTGANGCTSSCSTTITEPTSLTCSVVINSQVVCNGESNGSATVTALGGTMNYTYLWDNNETTAVATMLDAGTHTVTVTDANGCESSCSITLTEPAVLACNVVQNQSASCNGIADGQATVSPSGGNGGNAYLWDNNETTATATMLSSGMHTVTVTDSRGCRTTCTINIDEPAGVSCSTTLISNVICNNESNGSASVTPAGGTPNYTYLWDNGETTITATMLDAGQHSVIVTDANGCTSSCSVMITEPTSLTCSVAIDSQVVCNGESNGSATVTALGGTMNYTYQWDNGETTVSATMLDAGMHTVVVTDANGCTSSCSTTITEPTSLTCSVAINSQVVCNGESNGSATVTALGGTMNYTYLWDNNETTAVATMLDAGTHTVTVTDANGCESSCSITLTEPAVLACNATVISQVNCFGESNGQANVVATGGNGDNTYLWDNNETTATATMLAAGLHTVTVTDSKACTSICDVTIVEPSVLTCSTTEISPVTCFEDSDGVATVTATGGNGDYTYLWDNGETTLTAVTLVAGLHTVTVTDAGGCTSECNVLIGGPELLTCNVLEINPVTCNGDGDGSAMVSISGGNAGYTIAWDNGETTPTATMLNGGLHTVSVTDSKNCMTTCTVDIGETDELTCSITKGNDPQCEGGNGSATVATLGGNTSFTYLWDNGETTSTATMLDGGTRSVTVTDDKGCMTNCSIEMTDRTDCITIDKAFISANQTSAYCYDITYQITVDNFGVTTIEYDLSDTTSYDDDITITSAIYLSDAAEFFPFALNNSGEWVLANNQEIVAGKIDTYSMTVNVCLDLGDGIEGDDIYSACGSGSSNNTPTPDEGLFNTASLDLNNDGVAEEDASACGDIPYIVHEKQGPAVSVQNVDLTYDVTYLIVVENIGGAGGTYDLYDTPYFDDDITINASSFTANNGLSGSLSTFNNTENNLANDQGLGSGDIDTFTIVFNVNVDLSTSSMTGDNVYNACGAGSSGGAPVAGEGLFNQSALDLDNDNNPEEISEVCGDLPYLTHEKTGPTISSQNADLSYDVVYTIEVKNKGGATGLYDLVDIPTFDNDVVINSASYTADNGLSGLLSTSNIFENTLADDQSLAANLSDTYTVAFNVSLDLNPTSLDAGDNIYIACGENMNIQGPRTEALLNTSTLDTNNDSVPEETSEACGELPFIILEKMNPDVSDRLSDGTYNVTYTINVENIGGATGPYDLFDRPQFENDIKINSASFTSSNGLSGTLTINNDLQNQLADDQNLGADSMDIYTVVFNVTLDLSGVGTDLGDNSYDECGSTSSGLLSPFEGLYNLATIDTNNDGIPEQEDDGCGDIYIFDLASKKSVNPGQVIVYGGEVMYTIIVYNQGNINAQNIGIIDYLPAGITYSPSSNALGWTYNSSDSTATTTITQVIAPGDSAAITIIGIVGEGPDWTNYTEITSSEDDMNNDTSNSDIDSTPNDDDEDDNGDETTNDEINDNGNIDEDDHDPATIDVFDLAFVKSTLTTGSVNIGDTVAFEFKVYNQGNLTAYDIDLMDYINSGFLYVQSINNGWAASGDNAVTRIEGPLAPRDSVIVVLKLLVINDGSPEGGDWINEGEITSADDNETPSDNPPTDFDSTPDNDPDNDNDVEPGDDNDDESDEHGNGDDEDDNDVSEILVNGAIGDFVWEDIDADGIQDIGEPGIEGIIVNVIDTEGNIIGSDTTDINGYYLVDELPPGDYIVQFITDDLTEIYNPSPENEGANDFSDSDANENGSSGTVTLSSGEVDLSIDAGFYQSASLGDHVWFDANQNGQQDTLPDGSNEYPVEGAIITLYDGEDNVIAMDTTDANGYYQFTDLIPGNYYIGFMPYDSLILTQSETGSDITDNDIDPNTGRSIATTLVSGENDNTWDVGLIVDPAGEIIDPCTCHDIQYDNVDLYQLLDGVLVTGIPGDVWTIIAQTGIQAIDTLVDIEVSIGTELEEIEAGRFTYRFAHDAGLGYTIIVSNGVDEFTFENICEVPEVIFEPISEICFYDEAIPLGGSASLGGNAFPGTFIYWVLESNGDSTVITDFDPSLYEITNTFALYGRFVPNDPNQCPRTSEIILEINEECLASVGNYVWKDLDADGVQDMDELGVEGVSVVLENCQGDTIAITATAADGSYLFEDVIPGDYQVVFDITGQAEGCGYTIANTTSDDNDSDADSNGFTDCFTLGPDEVNTTIDAGLVPLFVNIGNYVWHDVDGDGIQDPNEEGIGNVSVILYNDENDPIASTVTDENGYYLIEDVLPDTYYIVFVDPNGYDPTFPNTTDDSDDSDITNFIINTGGSTTDLFDIVPGQEDDLTIDAGYYRCAEINGFVWHDLDLDDFRDIVENGLNGIKVGVYEANSEMLYDEVYTGLKPGTPSDDGYFSFCVPPGDYYVSVNLPPRGLVLGRRDYTGGSPYNLAIMNPSESDKDSDMRRVSIEESRSDVFTVTSGFAFHDNIGAGFYPMVTAGNLAWFDENGDGRQDPQEERIADVLVEVFETATNNKIDQDITNGAGIYSIDHLQATSYYLKFSPPSGYAFTVPNTVGELEDSDVDGSNGPRTTKAYSFEPDQDYVNIDAGLRFGVLPVDWLSILVKRIDDAYNKIEWSTAQEINASHFEVERSLNSSEWKSIGRIESAGTTSTETKYTFGDRDAEIVGLYNYRIKQVDFDEAVDYSNNVSIKVEGSRSYDVYPNPSTGIINLDLYLDTETQFSIDVFDTNGKVVLVKIINEDLEEGNHSRKLDLTEMPSGVYTLRITFDHEVINESIILMK